MLKELQQIFRRKGLIEQSIDDCIEMLNNDWEMFTESVKSLRESDTADISLDIEAKDIQINKFEREVRKKVLTHLAVNDVSDLNVGLTLINIVVDIERIGDYCKNIVELAQNHPGKLFFDQWEKEMKQMEDTISNNFDVLIKVLKEANTDLAKQLLDELWTVKKTCENFNMTLLKNSDLNLKVTDAVALALYMRYLKRIASHLMNVASSIVNPFHRIGYRAIG
ncbi:MAG: PhoU domain-containing protein [bacterium]|nr:PhoU domain-containing protein [bacterium]